MGRGEGQARHQPLTAVGGCSHERTDQRHGGSVSLLPLAAATPGRRPHLPHERAQSFAVGGWGPARGGGERVRPGPQPAGVDGQWLSSGNGHAPTAATATVAAVAATAGACTPTTQDAASAVAAAASAETRPDRRAGVRRSARWAGPSNPWIRPSLTRQGEVLPTPDCPGGATGIMPPPLPPHPRPPPQQ